jgi:peroxiredoxin
MALTPSNMMPLGTTAPEFNLLDTQDSSLVSLDSLKGTKGTLVAFICNHCPYVVHIMDSFIETANQYQEEGISFIAISSNSTESHPQDGPEHMKSLASEKNFSFPYLFDKSQATARAYNAACTPDLFLFDKDLKCVYRGEYDNTRPDQGCEATGESLKKAMDNLLQGKPPLENQQPSIGCNIKWNP